MANNPTLLKMPLAADGEKATITAIYGIYAQRSDYKGNADDIAVTQSKAFCFCCFNHAVYHDGCNVVSFTDDRTTDTS